MQHQLGLVHIDGRRVVGQQSDMHAACAQFERGPGRHQRRADHAARAADHRDRAEQAFMAVVRAFREVRNDLLAGEGSDALVHFHESFIWVAHSIIPTRDFILDITMFRVSVGSAALSEFRLLKLRSALQSVAPGVRLADTRHCYFIALREGGTGVSGAPSPKGAARGATFGKAQARLLDRVLGLAAGAGEPGKADTLQRVLVVPRLGTISPWSSKATDIAQHCGLAAVQRIERGVVYYLEDRERQAAGQRGTGRPCCRCCMTA